MKNDWICWWREFEGQPIQFRAAPTRQDAERFLQDEDIRSAKEAGVEPRADFVERLRRAKGGT